MTQSGMQQPRYFGGRDERDVDTATRLREAVTTNGCVPYSLMLQAADELDFARQIYRSIRDMPIDKARAELADLRERLRAAVAACMSPAAKADLSRLLCNECGVNWADSPSKLCPGCQAYKEHQQ